GPERAASCSFPLAVSSPAGTKTHPSPSVRRLRPLRAMGTPSRLLVSVAVVPNVGPRAIAQPTPIRTRWRTRLVGLASRAHLESRADGRRTSIVWGRPREERGRSVALRASAAADSLARRSLAPFHGRLISTETHRSWLE